MSKNHSFALVRFREVIRRIVRLWGWRSSRDIEYDFAYRQVTGVGIRVLDIGGSESLLPLQFAKRGYTVTVQDFREYPEKHPNLKSIQGDFLTNDFLDSYFDFVVLISTIEHIGFGSYGAPIYEDGDMKAIKEARRIVKPAGRIVITFPFASKEHHVVGFERWYDFSRVRLLFKGLHVLVDEYYIPDVTFMGRKVKWIPSSLEQITTIDDSIKLYRGPCFACFCVSPVPRINYREIQ